MTNYKHYKNKLIELFLSAIKISNTNDITSCTGDCDNCISFKNNYCNKSIKKEWLYKNWETKSNEIKPLLAEWLGINKNTNEPNWCGEIDCENCLHCYQGKCTRGNILWLNKDKI